MYCIPVCYIINFKVRSDTFTFNYILNDTRALYMSHVLRTRIDQPILEQLLPFIDTLTIKESSKLNWISVPQALKSLTINGSSLRRIDIAANSLLDTLQITYCDLANVPRSVRNAPKLRKLRVGFCQLSAIDLASFCDYPHLESLELDGNKIRYVVNTSNKYCSMYDALSLLKLSSNLLTTLDVNRISPNVTMLSMRGNVIECSWISRTDRSLSECYRNDLLVVTSVGHSDAKLSMRCLYECYIKNFKHSSDAFAFRYIKNDTHELHMKRVLMVHVEPTILQQLPPFIDTLEIEDSRRLKWISVPQALRGLTIENSGLRRIDFAANSSISTLHITYCDLTNVSHAVRNAPNLRILRIGFCQLSAIDLASFCDYPHLESLELDGNKIRYVVNTSNKYCSMYDALSLLKLSSNLLTTVDMKMFNAFVALTNLQLNINRIASIEEDSRRLKWISVPQALRGLTIENSGLRRIDFAANSSISTLHITYCDLTNVSHAVRNAPNLRILRIGFCQLSAIDLASFCDYPHLESLELDGNKIRYVVNTSNKYCSMYDALSLLKLSSNLLTTVDMKMFNAFVALTNLQLNINRIASIEGRLMHNRLRKLHLGENELEQVNLCGWNVSALRTLSFEINRFTMIPDCLSNWTNLTMLIFNYNRFTNFSIRSLAKMRNLTRLYMDCNRLTSIMLNSVHFPPNLVHLNIAGNMLTSLDLSFIPVRSLRVYAAYNLISYFDANSTSPNVTKLSMRGNVIDCSWTTPSERSSSKCFRDELSILPSNRNIEYCDRQHVSNILF
uniref:Uncharacterized protein n=1 Tax=Anopheles epiroticus TaxID=199890 RepID=A0A182PRM5_9DIPT